MNAIEPHRGERALSPFRAASFLAQEPLFRRMERLFDGMLADALGDGVRASTGAGDGMLHPRCDIEETEDAYHLTFDVPGLKREDVNIEMEGNTLVVSGERSKETSRNKGTEHYVERRFGRFERRFSLPQDIVADDVRATYRDGELRLELPKAHREPKRRIALDDGTSVRSSQGSERTHAEGAGVNRSKEAH